MACIFLCILERMYCVFVSFYSIFLQKFTSKQIYKINKMERKYDNKKISQALEPWLEYAHTEPDISSLRSRMIDKNANTSIVLSKKQSLFNFSAFPSHYYLAVDGKIWHPGNRSTETIFTTEDCVDSFVVSIEELCYHCTYHKLLRLFSNDRQFNVITNNCQKIMGYFFETVSIIVYHASLILFLLTDLLVFFLLSLSIVFIALLYAYMSRARNHVLYKTCKHVRKFNNI